MKRALRSYLPVFVAIGPLLSLISCSTSSSPQPSASAQQVSGVSGNLSRLTGGPLWNIESVGPVNNAFEKKTFDLPAHGKFEIAGWAVDQEAQAAAGGVEVVIDGTPFPAQYGTPRPDVAAAYKNPSYANAGYSFMLDTGTLAPGSHTAFVRVLNSSRKGFWEAGPYTLNLQ
jgi:hypothetical protein